MEKEKISIRQELNSALAKISYQELLSIAAYKLSEDSKDTQRNPCYRRGGVKDRSEGKVLLMNKGQANEMIYDLRDAQSYDKFSFMYKYRDDFYAAFNPHAWGNDFTRLKDAVRNMTGQLANSEVMQKARAVQQETTSSVSTPFDPNRWYTKPLFETPKAASQQLYLMGERGISKETLTELGANIWAISDMLKFKAPSKKNFDQITKLIDGITELSTNKKELVMSFIRSMDNIDTHFDSSRFKFNIIEPLVKEGISEEAQRPIINLAASCTPFEINRKDDTALHQNSIAEQFRKMLDEILQKEGIQDHSAKSANYASLFNSCFFEKQLNATLLNMENELPESYIESTQALIANKLTELRQCTPVSDTDMAQAFNFITNIRTMNLKDSRSYEQAFRQAFACLSPQGIYHFNPEYQPISKIRKTITESIAALRQQPILKVAAEVRKLAKNPMYRTINIAFASKDYRTQEIKGYEVKCINRSVKVNVSGSDFMNNFVYFGQQDSSKVKNSYVFESSIDAFSYADLQRQNGKPLNMAETVLISCAGIPKSRHMPLILELFPEAQIHLALDRDFPGKKATIQANCQLQGLKAIFIVTAQHDKMTPIPANEKHDEIKYPRKGRVVDPNSNQLFYKETINDKYDITVQGEKNGAPFNKTSSFITDEISVLSFHERFPEVKKMVQYLIPTIAYHGQVGKQELGGHEITIPTKDWNEMLVAPKTEEKLNREFTQKWLSQRNQEKTQAINSAQTFETTPSQSRTR